MPRRLQSILLLAGGVAGALATAALAAPRDLVLYNHSPSVPEGFYVRTNAPAAVGAFVTVRARDVAPEQAASRGFDDASDRFIKRVAAAAGARVCGDGQRVVVSGDNIIVIGADDEQQQQHAAGDGHHDGGGGDDDDDDDEGHRRAAAVRVLHAVDDADVVGWRGCRVLAEGEVLLLGDTADSFDGRYWGPVRVELIEGVWRRF
ncbi:MAG: S26 family signal peptidase [Hyphomonadaceae bacterium]|nr:S26 family signal peptidase [Hyphomonadaceae bacterium]